MIPTRRELKVALIIGYYGLRTAPAAIPLVRVDADQQIVQVRYYFGGRLPLETWFADGAVVEPVHAKIRDFVYFGRILMHERIAWLPATAEIQVSVNGHRMPLALGAPAEPAYAIDPRSLWRRLTRRRHTSNTAAGDPVMSAPGPQPDCS